MDKEGEEEVEPVWSKKKDKGRKTGETLSVFVEIWSPFRSER